MEKIKNRTFNSLVGYYQNHRNLDRFLEVCKTMIRDKKSTPEMRGEICESVLYVMLKDYIDRNKLKDWRISKGLILKDIKSDRNSKFLTELDLVLFTPKCVFSFECKSYRGEKYLAEEGTLYVKNGNQFEKKLDVFKQHYNHFKVLGTNINSGLLSPNGRNTKTFKSHRLLYFDFSDVPTLDKRSEANKKVFPICNVNNLYSLFKDYDKRPDYWNMDFINKVVDVIESVNEKNTKNHRAYVSGLVNSNSKSK